MKRIYLNILDWIMGDRKPLLWSGRAPHQRAPSVQPVCSIISRHALSRQESTRVTSVSAATAHNMFTSWHVDSGGLKNHYKPVEGEAKSKLFPRGSDDSENIFQESRSVVNNSLFFFLPSTFKETLCALSAVFRFWEHMWHFNMSCQSWQELRAQPHMNYEVAALKQWIVLPNRDLSIPRYLLFPAS